MFLLAFHKIKRTIDYKMSELDWDDPNYVEAPTKYYHTTYESSTYRDDDYSRGRRSGAGSDGSYKHRNGNRNRRDSTEDYANKRRAHYDRNEGSAWGGNDHGFSESISISTDMVGRIIGRGGSNISRIQNEFNVRIKVDKVELIVRVSGEQKTNVSDATNQLRKQVESEPGERERKSYGGGDGRSRFDDNRSSSYGRSSFNFAPAAPAEIPVDGDLTGTIDWQALNKASVS